MFLYWHLMTLIIIFYPSHCYIHIYDDPPLDALQNSDGFNILVGGRAERNQFPYQVSLQQLNKKNDFLHVCSGAVLSNKWVVSTGYCATSTKTPLRIVAGLLVKYETNSDDVQIIEVKNIIVHPGYKSGTISENDIALLELQTILVFTQSVQPILITKEFSHEVWGAAMLSGWNVQTQVSKEFSLDTLQYMIVYVMVEEDCENVLRGSTVSPTKVLCSKKTIEAFYCPGESGSPLVYNDYLIGITSWGLKPCGTTVYTKVASFVDFIQIYVKK